MKPGLWPPAFPSLESLIWWTLTSSCCLHAIRNIMGISWHCWCDLLNTSLVISFICFFKTFQLINTINLIFTCQNNPYLNSFSLACSSFLTANESLRSRNVLLLIHLLCSILRRFISFIAPFVHELQHPFMKVGVLTAKRMCRHIVKVIHCVHFNSF